MHSSSPQLVLGTNTYPLQVALGGAANLAAQLETQLTAHRVAGFAAWEPIIETEPEIVALITSLKKHGLLMPSFYANARLHAGDVEAVIAHVTRLAAAAAPYGARWLVTNPEPVRWGGPETKTDAELARQATALNALGEALAPLGMAVAYHFHDAELRDDAREVRHVLTHTNPARVRFCFDLHWAYRGLGNDAEAAFALLDECSPRIASFHLRQSRGGVWSEQFGAGDLDYGRWARWLRAKAWSGPVILEQCWESGTPRTGPIETAQTQGLAYLRALLA
jgi:inosose dehydratase